MCILLVLVLVSGRIHKKRGHVTFLCGYEESLRPALWLCVKSLYGVRKTSFSEAMNVKSDFKRLEVPEPGDICQEPLHTGIRTNPRQRGWILQATKQSHLNHLIVGIMELQDLEHFLQGFGLALVKYFPILF